MFLTGNQFDIFRLLAGLITFILSAMTSSSALAERQNWSFPGKNMSHYVDQRNVQKEETFLKALNDHQGIIYKICRVYRNNRHDEEDLFQEIVYQLWKAYPAFQNKSAISTWMHSIAIKVALVPYKRERLRVDFVEKIPERAADDPARNHSHDKFFNLIQRLNKVDRAIIVLMMENYTRTEIAAVMGMNETAVRMRLIRVRLGIKSEENI